MLSQYFYDVHKTKRLTRGVTPGSEIEQSLSSMSRQLVSSQPVVLSVLIGVESWRERLSIGGVGPVLVIGLKNLNNWRFDFYHMLQQGLFYAAEPPGESFSATLKIG